MIWAGEIIGIVAVCIIFGLLNAGNLPGFTESTKPFMMLILLILLVALVITGIVGTYVYLSNYLVITNKRAIQSTIIAIFSRSVNIIDLQSVEDVSFKQDGILDFVLNMGTIRLSTIGDETTYTFPYVETPRDEIRTITRLVSSAKAHAKPKPHAPTANDSKKTS